MTEYEKQCEDWVGGATGLALFVAAALFAVVMMIGCDQKPMKPPPPSQTFKIPEGLPTDQRVAITQETHSGGSTETAKGTGAGMTASGDKASIGDFKSTAPTVGGGGASGGSTSGDMSAITEGGGKFGLFAIGALFLAASAFGIYRRWPLRGIVGLGACGGACIVAGLLPGWAVFLLAGCGVLGAVCWLWSEAHGHAATVTATAAARAVENVKDADTRRQIKADVADYAGTAKASVEKVVGKIKKRYGLISEKQRTP